MQKLLLSILFSLFSFVAVAEPILLAEDLAQDAVSSRTLNKPIVLFVTAEDCPYCEQLRQEYFKFSPGDERFILREVELGVYHRAIDFDGKISNHQLLADRYDISLTPTVAFVGPEGNTLTKPIIGVLTMDFYNYYFEKALAESITQLKTVNLATSNQSN